MKENNQENFKTEGEDTSKSDASLNEVQNVGGDETKEMNGSVATKDLSSEKTVAETAAPKANKKLFAVLGVGAVLIIAALLWLLTTDSEQAENMDGAAETAEESASLDDIPQIAAVVNGVEIPKAKLVDNVEFLSNMAAQQGADPSDPTLQSQIFDQAIERTINNELLEQAALEAGVSVSESEVEARYQELQAQFPSEEEFLAQLETSGMTSDELKENIRAQMVMDEYFVNSDVLANLPEVTDEESLMFYEQLVANGNELPEFETLNEQIKSQLEQQSEQQAILGLIAELREAAEIEMMF